MQNIFFIVTDAILLAISIVLLLRIRKIENDRNDIIGRYKALCATVDHNYGTLKKRIDDLEGGLVPDYEAAKDAAAKMNDFNAGLSGLFGFSPMDALKKQRQEM